MNRARDVRHVTHIFPTFLGLRLIPVGLWFLVVGLASSVGGRLPTGVLAVLVVLATASIWPIHLWYRREFGVVEPERLGLGRNWMILLGLGLAVLALSLGAQKLGGTATLVLLLVLVFFATAVLFALPRAFGGGTMAIALLSAVVVLGAALLLLIGRDPARFNYLGALFSLVVGVILCAAGVVEHLLMKRALDRLGSGDDV